jgi:hypothetical protein
MAIDRIAQLQKQYELQQRQLDAKEIERGTAAFGDRERIQQQIDEFIQPELKKIKQQYLNALAEEKTFESLSDKQAEVVIGEIVDELKAAKSEPVPSEVTALLEQILAKLNEPEKAILRLKLGMKLPFEFFEAGAEWEGEAVTLWQEHCPTFESWRVKASKKLFPQA